MMTNSKSWMYSHKDNCYVEAKKYYATYLPMLHMDVKLRSRKYLKIIVQWEINRNQSENEALRLVNNLEHRYDTRCKK